MRVASTKSARGKWLALILVGAAVGTAILGSLAAARDEGVVPEVSQQSGAQSWQAIRESGVEYDRLQRLAVPRNPDDAYQVTLIGDSITNEGYYATSDQATYRELLRNRFPARSQVAVVRYGFAGATTQDALASLPDNLPLSGLVVIELGTNDIFQSEPGSSRTDAYRRIVERVRKMSSKAALICLGVWGGGDDPTVVATNDEIRSSCRAGGGRFLSMSYLYDSAGLRGPAGSPTQDGGVSDDFHPNDDGHSRIADLILSQVRTE